MKLPSYNVKITLSDPDDPDVELVLTLDRVPREKLLTTPIPMKNTVETFESMVKSLDKG